MPTNRTDELLFLDTSSSPNIHTKIGTDDIIVLTGTADQDTILLTNGDLTLSSGNLTVGGNLIIDGTTTTIDTETILVQDNYIDINYAHTTASTRPGGLVVNYSPTAAGVAVAGAAFTASTVEVSSGAGFTAGEFIQVSGAADSDNNGIYEIDSVATNTITIELTGTKQEDFSKGTFVADSTVQGTVTRVGLAVIRAGTDGVWETASGTTAGLSYTDLGSAAGNNLQQAYDQGATITTDATGPIAFTFDTNARGFTMDGDAAGVGDVTMGATNTINTFTVDAAGAISLDAAAASNLTTSSGAMTLSGVGVNVAGGSGEVDITTTGTLDINTGPVDIDASSSFVVDATGIGLTATAGLFNINATSTVNIDSSGGSIQIGSDADTGAINVGTGAAARTISIGNETGATALDLDAGTGGVTIDAQGAGVIQIGNQADTGNIDVGTGASARTITIGNNTGATTLALETGSGGVQVDADGNSAWNIAGTYDVQTSGAITIDSSGSTIGIGTDTDTGAINIGTAASARTITIGNTTGATAIDILAGTGQVDVTGDMTVSGNLTVSGSTTTTESETVLIADNHLYLNDGYTTTSAETGGLVVNYLPTATTTTVNGNFTAGVASTSNPTVVTTGSGTFSSFIGSFIQISGANDPSNDGLYEVLSHVGTTLTIRGIGTTATTEDFTQNQFTADTVAAGTITRVNVSILRAGTDGTWEQGSGSTTPVSFEDLATAAGSNLQAAYDAQAGTTVTGSDAFDFDLTGAISLDSTVSIGIGADADTSTISVGTGAAARTINIGNSTGATALTLASGTGDVTITSTDGILIDGDGSVQINSSGGPIQIGQDAAVGDIDIGTGAAARTIDIGNGTGATVINLDAGTGGVNVGTNAVAHTVTIGNNTGVTAVAVETGSGGYQGDYDGNSALAIAGTYDVQTTGAITIDTDSGGTIGVGTDPAAQTVTVGNTTSTTAVNVNSGTGGIALASTGTGDITLDSDDTLLIDADGVIEINSPGGTMSIGNDADDSSIDIGTGTTSGRAITIGNGTGITSITLDAGTGNVNIGSNATTHSTTVGSTSTTSDTTIQSGTGDLAVTASGSTADVNIAAGRSVSIDAQGVTGSIFMDLGTDTSATTWAVRNNSGTFLMSITADGAIDASDGTLDVPFGTSFLINGTALTTANFTAANMDTLLDGSDASSLHTHGSVAEATNAVHSSTSVAAIADGAAVYVSGSGTVDEADASAIGTGRFFGVAKDAALATSAVDVYVTGVVAIPAAQIDGAAFSGPGVPVYLSENAGHFTSAAPTTSGAVVQEVGISTTTTAMLIQPKAPVVI